MEVIKGDRTYFRFTFLPLEATSPKPSCTHLPMTKNIYSFNLLGAPSSLGIFSEGLPRASNLWQVMYG